VSLLLFGLHCDKKFSTERETGNCALDCW